MRLWPLQNARVYLKTPNAPGQRAFLRCAASFFLEIRQYSCEKMSCATQKSLAAGHIMSFQIHPSFSITSSSISCSSRRISFCKTVGVEDRFPQCPLFLQLRDLFQLGCILRPQLFCMFPDGFIQNFLVAAVRAAIVFPVPIAAASGLSTRFLYRISFRMAYLTGRKLENRIFEEAMKFRSCHSLVRS